MQVDHGDDADHREVDPPIEVEVATWSAAGQLDWWWLGRVWGGDRGLGAGGPRSGFTRFDLDDVVVGGVRIEDCLRNRCSPIGPQKISQLFACVVGIKEQRRKHLAPAGLLSGVDSAINQAVESIIEHDGPIEADLPVPGAPKALVERDRMSFPNHVLAHSYNKHMFVKGLSDLIVTIMAAGGVVALPAQNHRRCHEALAELHDNKGQEVDRLWARFGGRPQLRRDPDVGRRVEGVTSALWEAVNVGKMRAYEEADGSEGFYSVTDSGAAIARRELMRLPAKETELLYGVGAAWASASTARKNRRSAPTSFASIRVSNFA
jgi:hypothetical protein